MSVTQLKGNEMEKGGARVFPPSPLPRLVSVDKETQYGRARSEFYSLTNHPPPSHHPPLSPCLLHVQTCSLDTDSFSILSCLIMNTQRRRPAGEREPEILRI